MADIIWSLAIGFFGLAGVYWGVNLLGVGLLLSKIRRLDDFSLSSSDAIDWPSVSILVPARNEESTLRDAAESLLKLDYPQLELLMVDDRSTDQTGRIMEELARNDSRVRVCHIDHLPQGWLGKNHALHRAMELSSGDWVLMTDADVHFHPLTLRRAVAYCRRKEIDHLCLAPEFHPVGILIDCLLTGFVRLICLGMRIWNVSDRRKSAFVGVGAFNLVRRESFKQTKGFPWLRMEVADDLGVGLLMQDAGKSTEILLGNDCVGLHWYRNLSELKSGAEKSYASLASASFVSMLGFLLLGGLMEFAPLLAVIAVFATFSVPPTSSFLAWTAMFSASGTLLMGIISSVAIARWSGRSLATALLYFLFVPAGIYVMLRAGYLGNRRGGALWRGTLYSKSEILKGKRVFLLPGGGKRNTNPDP